MKKLLNLPSNFLNILLLVFLFITVNGCSIYRSSGKYYKDDGPGSLANIDLNSIPNATPKRERIRKQNTKPYKALGQTFYPMKSLKPYKERGEISWYGKKYHGNKTAIGERYDMYKMTAASPVLPLPSYVKVTNLKNDKTVIVRVNDRGPFLRGRILDLSYVAAAKLGYMNNGVTYAEVELIIP